MAEQWVCIVCGETVDERTSSVCNSCGERFHLNQRNDRPGKDCGEVWINEQYLALEFACQRCLRADPPPPPPRPRILRAEPQDEARRPRLRPRRYRRID